MLIKASDEYKNDLFSLWKEAFGDEDGYINLFFDTVYKKSIIVFAELDDEKVVSSLYLIPSYIRDNGTAYEGFYLYAAATLKSYRGKGIMKRLINEAKSYALEEKKAFISLVPGEEYLYSYYKKFGFEPVMYRGKDIIKGESSFELSDAFCVTLENYFDAREKEIAVTCHHLCTEAYRYALECFEYMGLKAYAYDKSLFIYDGENNCVKEFFSESENDLIKSVLPKREYTVYSPFGEMIEPYGMVWFADENTKIKKIYMNIALD